MPPIVTPGQGSRTGMLAALVTSIIIAVAMIVVAAYAFQQWSHAEEALATQTQRDKGLVGDASGVQNDPRFAPYINNALSTNALDAAVTQAQNLARQVAGDVPPDKAEVQAQNTLKQVLKDLKENQQIVNLTMPESSNNLTSALTTVSAQLIQCGRDKQAAMAQVTALQQQTQQMAQDQKKLLAEKDKAIADANSKAEENLAAANKYKQEADQAQAQLMSTSTADIKKLQEAAGNLTGQLQQRDKQLKDLGTNNLRLTQKLHLNRVNPAEAMIQHPDGNILRVVNASTVFINIGQRQSVTPGLTFEVYDKNKGIPPLGNGLATAAEADMPVGKASLEVFQVNADTAECHVTKVQQGEQIVIGDLIANLVFDPTVKYKFVVYGNFDLSNAGAPNSTDTEIIKRLITQWGGVAQSNINVDTDFVIMGKEPVVPPVTDPNDAPSILSHNQAQKRLDEYQAEVARATELSIPVMNQDRFLYFIGYYDQAKR